MLYQFEFRTYQRKFKRPCEQVTGSGICRSGIILRLVGEHNQLVGRNCPFELVWFGNFWASFRFLSQLPGNFHQRWCSLFPLNCRLVNWALSQHYKRQKFTPPSPPLPGGRKANLLTFPRGGEELSQYSGLLPAGETALQALPMLWLEGYRTFKWKLGVAAIEQELTIFQQLIQAMHNFVRSESAFFAVDANGGLSYSEAKTWRKLATRKSNWLSQALIFGTAAARNPFRNGRIECYYATAIALERIRSHLDRIQEWTTAKAGGNFRH